MSTMIGYTDGQDTDGNGRLLQSLIVLARNFMSHSDSGIQGRNASAAQQFMPNVPARVWRRHSALLTMLVQQANSDEVQPSQPE